MNSKIEKQLEKHDKDIVEIKKLLIHFGKITLQLREEQLIAKREMKELRNEIRETNQILQKFIKSMGFKN
jgi:septation ring formation regulator EzrA